jgi:hypothetical protein
VVDGVLFAAVPVAAGLLAIDEVGQAVVVLDAPLVERMVVAARADEADAQQLPGAPLANSIAWPSPL